MQSEKIIPLYLSRYAEAEAAQVHSCVDEQGRALFTPAKPTYEFSLNIPVYDEKPHFIDALLPVCHKPTLLILVVNQPEGSAPNKNNRALLDYIKRRGSRRGLHGHLSLYSLSPECDVMLVDRTAPALQLPPKQGVGLARKIAADIALALYAGKNLQSPWLCCTDADALLPANYFSVQAALPNAAACLFPFRHHGPLPNNLPTQQQATQQQAAQRQTAQQQAAATGDCGESLACEDVELDYTLLYERKICDYVQGLQFAGSPYAYHALGSTLCVHALHYAAVRGFPKRSAGEDFYILNKLRKTGDVASLAQPSIALQARQSQRTPFGTGAAVANLCAAANPQASIFYHPGLYLCLRALLRWQAALANDRGALPREKRSTSKNWRWQPALAHFLLEQQLTQRVLPTVTGRITESLGQSMTDALLALGFNDALDHCEAQASSPSQYARHLQNWFDAFRSMRWLHELRARENCLNDVSETQAKIIWGRLLQEAAGASVKGRQA